MRLIDADELLEHAYRDKLDSRELIANMINNAPTVKEIPTKIPIGIFEKLVSQETCEDTISRKEAIKNIRELFSYGECYCDEYSIVGLMNNLPSVYPKAKVGKWIYDGDVTRCSNCKRAYDILFTGSNYCPNCGAKMEIKE